MRIFVLGATGTIGEALTAELSAQGHELIALARSEDAERKLAVTCSPDCPRSEVSSVQGLVLS